MLRKSLAALLTLLGFSGCCRVHESLYGPPALYGPPTPDSIQVDNDTVDAPEPITNPSAPEQ